MLFDPDAPTSSVTSVNVIVAATDNMELKCKVEGKQLFLRWYKDGDRLYASEKYQFSDEYRTLTVVRMGYPHDAGTYTCVGENPSGQANETHNVLIGT